MRAVMVEHPGKNALRDVPDPKPGPDEVLVRVTAAGVNPIDWKTRDRGQRKMPFVMGQDFAGLVVDVGENVHRYVVDDRIFGIAREHGAYAEYTVVPQDSKDQPVAGIPDDIGDADAAALPTAGLTALGGVDALDVDSGKTIAIVGVTGGVGGYAAQIAHARGVHVIGVAHSGQEELARSLGADEFVAYDTGDTMQAIAQKHPDGIDGILDLADDSEALKGAVHAIRRGGAVVSTIGAADEELFAKSDIRAINLYMLDTPEASHEGLRELARMVEAGDIKVRVSEEHPLSEADRALAHSATGGVTGKIILTI